MVGYLASSKAGHDKDKVYVILKEDKEYVWLADGKNRKTENPKKKKKKHIQIIKNYTDEAIRTSLINAEVIPDHVLRNFIKDYNKRSGRMES